MHKANISVGREAMKTLQEMVEKADTLGIRVEKLKGGSTLLDCGFRALGSIEAGRLIVKICMGGLCDVRITWMDFKDFSLPAVEVRSDNPAIAGVGSQMAFWRIPKDIAGSLLGDSEGLASGPARALAQIPKEFYEKIGYKDYVDFAILVIQSDKFSIKDFPAESISEHVANECKVDLKNVYLILVPTASIAGSVQIAGRNLGIGICDSFFRILDYDVKKVKYGIAISPIAPVVPDDIKSIGINNDMLMYGSRNFFAIYSEENEDWEDIIGKMVVENSPDYGKLYAEMFIEAERNFSKIDYRNYVPSEMVINDLRTGKVYRAGKLRPDLLLKSIEKNAGFFTHVGKNQ
ncbi:MAG: methenyltetrahydromethanopterin cyclohydrolase [Candidatus Bathyarchaeia archaeon]